MKSYIHVIIYCAASQNELQESPGICDFSRDTLYNSTLSLTLMHNVGRSAACMAPFFKVIKLLIMIVFIIFNFISEIHSC